MILKDEFVIIDLEDKNSSKEIIEKMKQLFLTAVSKSKQFGIWDESIKSIIVSDRFEDRVYKQAEKCGVVSRISKDKFNVVLSKIVFNNDYKDPEYFLFFDFRMFHNSQSPIEKIIFSQILNVSSNSIIPERFRQFYQRRELLSFDDYVLYAVLDWCKALYANQFLSKLPITKESFVEPISLLVTFKSKLKKSLYTYNSDRYDHDTRLSNFWQDYFENIRIFIRRLIENTEQDYGTINKDDPAYLLICDIMNEIKALYDNIQNPKKFLIIKIKEAIKAFSSHFEIYITLELSDAFKLELTKNPKEYFVGEIVETDQRIVCFMDILGFQKLIEKYDEDETSYILQDIQQYFSIARKQMILEGSANKESLRYLEHQTFSDNICVSIPYFDNSEDFLNNLNIIVSYSRLFQWIMSQKGFFIRGGLSLGSYYSDDNIIFSQGLVKAYKLESERAIYPRIVLDSDIIEKMIKSNHPYLEELGFGDSIIFDWEGIAFINPFGLFYSTMGQYQSILKLYDHSDDDSIMSEMMKSIGGLIKETIKTLEPLGEFERQNNQYIKSIIQEKIDLSNDEKVTAKYLWLYEFIRWLEKDGTAKLKFRYFSEVLGS